MNNLVKTVAIWMVRAIVLMTVFNQVGTQKSTQKPMEYSQFIDEVKGGRIAKVMIEGRVVKGVKQSGEKLTTYAPSDIWLVSDLLKAGVIVEAKASGQPLIDEMRRSGIFVQDYSPGKGQDKIARLNAVADMFASGHVWFPETHWAQATVEEIVSFPAAEHDDAVDACTLALARVRKGGLLSLRTDNEDNEPVFFRRKGGYY